MDIESLRFDEDGSIEIRGDKTQESSLLGVIEAVLEQALHLWQRNGDRTGGVRLSLREESRSPRFIDAQRTFHNGDPEPNLALWSTADPVTRFAARGLVDAGSERVMKTFRFVASTFSNVSSFEWETLASGVDGNFAYTVAIERYTASADGAPPTQTELRASHVYRREDGHLRAVHRHADRRPPD